MGVEIVRTRRRIGRVLVASLFMLVLVGDSSGFELDTHYYLTFGIALGTCFDWGEAHVIASADQMIDDNKTTVAETSLVRKKKKKAWHAFSHPEEQLNSLWYRVLEEEDPVTQLIVFGQFLHFLQDWEAHGGYPLGIGHALATITGKDPDSLAKDEVRTGAMVGATLDFMAKMCAALDRIPDDEDPDIAMMAMLGDLLVDRWFDEVVNQSRTNWRTKLGGFTKEGKEIMAQNKLRIEKMIEGYLKPIPEKGVPDDFQPGDPDHGIPMRLALQFDKNGNLEFELDPTIAEAYEVEEGARQGDDRVWLEKAEPVEDGWQVTIIANNEGGRPISAGRVRLVVADPVGQEQLGEVSRPFPGLEPDQRFEVEAMIPTSRVSEQVLIGLVVEIPDLSAANNSVWFMSEADLLELEEKLEGKDGSLDPGTVETIEFASEPTVWFSTLQEICTVVVARTNLGDPTKELVRPDIALVAADGEREELEGVWDRLWSITVISKDERPAAKSYGCFNASEVCGLDWGATPPELEITLAAGNTRSLKKITLGEAVADPVRELCSHSQGD
jgi:hypothetical protein